MKMLLAAWRSLLAEIRGINQRYSTPKIRMTGLVRVSLVCLRFYLLLLVGLLIYRFVTALR